MFLKGGKFVGIVRTCDLDLEIVLEKRLHESKIDFSRISDPNNCSSIVW